MEAVDTSGVETTNRLRGAGTSHCHPVLPALLPAWADARDIRRLVPQVSTREAMRASGPAPAGTKGLASRAPKRGVVARTVREDPVLSREAPPPQGGTPVESQGRDARGARNKWTVGPCSTGRCHPVLPALFPAWAVPRAKRRTVAPASARAAARANGPASAGRLASCALGLALSGSRPLGGDKPE